MFTSVLIANRGEIAVRIVQACRDLGIRAIALYDESDQGSLHVRLADLALPLTSEQGYLDQAAVIRHAQEAGAQAIHPGYGFLAERPEFIAACAEAGLVFIGPRAEVVALARDKIATLEQVRAAGIATPRSSPAPLDPHDGNALHTAARQVGYPLVIKSCVGGRGRGTRVVRDPDRLEEVARHTAAASITRFGDPRVYLEQAILPSRYVEVQILGDQHGRLIHLGERDSSIQRNNQKIITESPAPGLSLVQRERIWNRALDIARLLGCSNACTVEFVIDGDGQIFFTEVKPRIQIEHPVSELVTQVDIVAEQIRIAAGQPLSIAQDDVHLRGWAMQCRINAEDPWSGFLPSPGRIGAFRMPGGLHVRVDTYAYAGCDIPLHYDPIFAKIIVWGTDRAACLERARRALAECFIGGVQTNLPLLRRMLDDLDFARGSYTTEFSRRPLMSDRTSAEELRDLAVIAALAHLARSATDRTALPERVLSGWHRESRHLPS